MSAKHTPGPWWMVNFVSGVRIEGPDRYLVGHLGPSHGDAERLTEVANARLIAAAPEMYAALEMALASLEHARTVNPGEGDSEWLDGVDTVAHGFERAARAALKKARGEL